MLTLGVVLSRWCTVGFARIKLASGLRLPSDDISIARGSGPERARRACIRGPVIDLIDKGYCGTEHLLAEW